MIASDDATTLPLLYHLNSEPWLNEPAYREAAAYEVSYSHVESPGACLRLPSPPETALSTLLRRRRSHRAFEARAMPMETLASLLAGAYGITETATFPDGTAWLRRTVPSAGGLFPLDVYVFTERVDGIADGLHRYAVREHALETIRAGLRARDLGPDLLAGPFVTDVNALILLSAVFRRTQKKYGARGYRYILLEAGHVAQNICLVGTDLGLGTLCIGGFVDSGVNAALGLDVRKEGVVYAVGCGYVAESP